MLCACGRDGLAHGLLSAHAFQHGVGADSFCQLFDSLDAFFAAFGNDVCRTEFTAAVKREKKGGLYVFIYAGDGSVPPERVNLRSEDATVVIDTAR